MFANSLLVLIVTKVTARLNRHKFERFPRCAAEKRGQSSVEHEKQKALLPALTLQPAADTETVSRTPHTNTVLEYLGNRKEREQAWRSGIFIFPQPLSAPELMKTIFITAFAQRKGEHL